MKKLKELLVISGKGGTGKTSLTACFAYLFKNKIIVDADVDAADMHLLLKPKILKKEKFIGGGKAFINNNLCSSCGLCSQNCTFDAISENFIVDTISCEGCKVCVEICPEMAISFEPQVCGTWFYSKTRMGEMFHAKLGIAEENSGLLVSLLRKEAQKKAMAKDIPLIIIDGPPGIGCPVIASITGVSAILIITEPTQSGIHDMKRVLKLGKGFNIPIMLCINKYDLNKKLSSEIKIFAKKNNMHFIGSIPYDDNITKAMIQEKCIYEFSSTLPASKAVYNIWNKTKKIMDNINNIKIMEIIK
ncbi:MAG: (4Fe-4S)-binding protein [Desulfobacteraceae bacterium 4572_130]|nr:MAG: (4Fe-4S)-binding protein [Desulfobacteraceae bacterium 4572_130]